MHQRRSGSRVGECEPSRPKDWSAFFAPDAPVASEEFMVGIEDLPLEERAFFAVLQSWSTGPKKRRHRTKGK